MLRLTEHPQGKFIERRGQGF